MIYVYFIIYDVLLLLNNKQTKKLLKIECNKKIVVSQKHGLSLTYKTFRKNKNMTKLAY